MIRNATLPIGWYPHDPGEIRATLDGWSSEFGDANRRRSLSCVAPHAGWSFSGPLAAASIAHLDGNAGTVVIAGGHLMASDAPLVSTASGHRTPLGEVETDADLAAFLKREFGAEELTGLDNSTDALIPMAQHLLPRARVVVCRIPPRDAAQRIGSALAEYRAANGNGSTSSGDVTELVVIGSTDLTHYGPNFQFAPHGTGEQAHRWVVETNDAGFLDALARMDAQAALSHAMEHRSACSPGGAVVALSFAKALGATDAAVIGHYTSYDISPGASFVGYGGLAFN
jgi:hypothetical protein